MPLASVIIPIYNRSHLLREAIKSVLQQEGIDFELLVVDDGSTEDLASVCYGFSDSRIVYYRQNHAGQSSACNLGLLKAKGKYIAYLDSDDLWPRNYLKTMVEMLDNNEEYGAVYARVVVLCPDGKKEELSNSERNKSGWITRYLLDSGGPCLMPSAFCFRRSVWNNVFWDEAIKRSPDYDFFLRFSLETQFLFVPGTYVIKRSLPDSLSSSQDPICFIDKAHILERFYYKLGGGSYVKRRVANRKISRAYCKAGKISMALGNKHLAILWFRRAIKYYPIDIRLYVNLIQAVLGSSPNNAPNWQIPAPLPSYVTVKRRAQE